MGNLEILKFISLWANHTNHTRHPTHPRIIQVQLKIEQEAAEQRSAARTPG